MTLTCPQVNFKLASEVLNAGLDFTERLVTGETLSGTPTVSASSALTLSSKVVNSTTMTINGEGVAVGKAVQFVVAAGAAGTEYEIIVSCVSTAGQTVSEIVGLRVV